MLWRSNEYSIVQRLSVADRVLYRTTNDNKRIPHASKNIYGYACGMLLCMVWVWRSLGVDASAFVLVENTLSRTLAIGDVER